MRQKFEYGSGSLMLSQWTRFDLYGITLDAIRPLVAAPPFTLISCVDGLGYFLTAPHGDGVEMALALEKETWDELNKHRQFRRFSNA